MLHVFCKNARLSRTRLAELAGELEHFIWDVILFSETRVDSAEIDLEGGHRLYTSREDTPSSGVGILIHSRLVSSIVGYRPISDRVASVDIDYGNHRFTFIAVYMPHAGYPDALLEETYFHLHEAAQKATVQNRSIVVGGDFNAQINVGNRGLQLTSFTAAFGLAIANDDDDHATNWTFQSSMGLRRRIDFILAPHRLILESCRATRCLDLGSDHRAVEAIYRVDAPPIKRKVRGHSVRGWAPRCTRSYAEELTATLTETQPDTIELFDQLVASVASKHTMKPARHDNEGWRDPEFQTLLQRRRTAVNSTDRRAVSKALQKEVRKRVRRKKARQSLDILTEFENLSRLSQVGQSPVRAKRQPSANDCSPNAYAGFLADIFKTDSGQAGYLNHYMRTGMAAAMGEVPPFSMMELQRALKMMANKRCPDPEGLVVEMFKKAPVTVLHGLLHLFNNVLRTGRVDRTWLDTVFMMLPKQGDRSRPENWRPIAILPASYKVFSRLLFCRLQETLDRSQPEDQIGFRRRYTIDEAFTVLECICGKSIEWGVPCWIASLDLRKAFDKIEYPALFDALRSQGVNDAYLELLASIYRGQTGRVRSSSIQFPVERGVKQGDTISPLLFNAGLELAMSRWKARIGELGIDIGVTEKLTNIRYADDLLLYAHSVQDLTSMIDALCEELLRIGLHLNTSKTKICTTATIDIPLQIDAGGDFVQVLSPGQFHRYLGKRIPGELKNRWLSDIDARIQSAWASFHKYKHVLVSKDVPLRHRLKLFSAVVTPTALFGLKLCPSTQTCMNKLDVAQRKMLRLVVGWVRRPDEEWSETMRRMRDRLDKAMEIFPVQDWSKQLMKLKFKFAHTLANRPSCWAYAASTWLPFETYPMARRLHGRPATRWDDDLEQFAQQQFGTSWPNAARGDGWLPLEENFITFMFQS